MNSQRSTGPRAPLLPVCWARRPARPAQRPAAVAAWRRAESPAAGAGSL